MDSVVTATSEYRLSTHFVGMSMAVSQQRFSVLTMRDIDERYSFVEQNISTNVKLVKSRRDVSPMYSHWGIRKVKKPLEKFCTGSRYIGEWNALGFSGDGIYRYPHGVIYEGEFNKNGKFHGLGSLIYPSGQKIEGIWKNGKLTDGATYIFASGEYLDENFRYCQPPDRKFHLEIQKDFGPVGQEYLTNDQPTRKLPEGCYDAGTGIYNPKTRCIMLPIKPPQGSKSKKSQMSHIIDEVKFKDFEEISLNAEKDLEEIIGYSRKKYENSLMQMDDQKFVEIPTKTKVEWIKRNCRKAWDEPTKYRPDFYTTWMAGRKKEVLCSERSQSNTTFLDYEKIQEGENVGEMPETSTKGFVNFTVKPSVMSEKSRQVRLNTYTIKHDGKKTDIKRYLGYENRTLISKLLEKK